MVIRRVYGQQLRSRDMVRHEVRAEDESTVVGSSLSIIACSGTLRRLGNRWGMPRFPGGSVEGRILVLLAPTLGVMTRVGLVEACISGESPWM